MITSIIGQTGAGKSTFINKYIGSVSAEVGTESNLGRCTQGIHAYTVPLGGQYEGRRLVLVDTPGLDDIPQEEDTETLRNLSTCLMNCHSQGASVVGALYLHDISQRRGNHAARIHLNELQRLIKPLKKSRFTIALVTTQWDGVAAEIGARRETEFANTFWKELVKQGVHVVRAAADGSQVSIINMILGYGLN